jgi:hypothetical protein
MLGSKSRMGWVVVASLWSAATIVAAQQVPEIPKPGKEHAVLAREVGTWEATIKTWSSPQGEPEVTKGTETNTLLPGGLWLISAFEGKIGVMDFHGRSHNGYDTNKKKYVSSWVDSMTTSPMVREGSYDAAGQSMTLVGDTVDPAGNKSTMRIVSKYRPDGTRVSSFFMKAPDNDDQFKMMEIEYVKKSK